MACVNMVLYTVVLLANLPVLLRSVNGAETDYVIDTLVVVDDFMYNSWRDRLYLSNITSKEDIMQRIKQYVSLVLHQANKRLATSSRHANFSLKLQVVDMDIDQDILTFVPARLLSGKVDADVALEAFRQWLIKQGKASTYDHAMLLTGRVMESSYEGLSDGNVAGRAYVGKLCDRSGMSVSIVQDSGGFQSVYFVAHEAAHSLGAYHDGEDEAVDCSADLRFLMAAVSQQTTQDGVNSDVSDHPWYLSACSVRSIRNFLNRLESSENNCLKTTSSPLTEFSTAASLEAGQLYDAVQQCQMLYGPRSNLCLGKDFSNLDQVCTAMFCSRGASSCVQHYAAEGTSCGNKTWCQLGRCVASDAAPEMDDECPYGDTALQLGNDRTCGEFVSRSPSACYSSDTRQSCCASCAKIHSGLDVCPYGDKRSGCTQDLCHQVLPDGTFLADLCCGTCGYKTPLTCQDVADVDGFTCRERSTAYSTQECYNATVAYHCCETCAGRRVNVSDCAYGDRVTGGYCQNEAKSDYSGCTGSIAYLCCHTCNPDFRSKVGGDPNSSSIDGTNTGLLCALTLLTTFVRHWR